MSLAVKNVTGGEKISITIEGVTSGRKLSLAAKEDHDRWRYITRGGKMSLAVRKCH